MTGFDRRLTPARPDLAAEFLRSTVAAERFVSGLPRRVTAAVADLRREPRSDCPLDTQAIRGEIATVYEDVEGWAWVQLARDGYVGWLSSDALGPVDPAPTHRVSLPRTLVFPGPDLKRPIVEVLTEGAAVTVRSTVETRGLVYGVLPDATAIVLKHLAPLSAPCTADPVAAARAYLGTPYLWGGRTAFGLDCSGLVQTVFEAAGVSAPRDSDMQEAGLGEALPIADRAVVVGPDGTVTLGGVRLLSGDLIFWKGHVALVSGDNLLLHANGFHMTTVEEPLDAALTRIAESGSEVTTVRRVAR